jgi:hypothetical protein
MHLTQARSLLIAVLAATVLAATPVGAGPAAPPIVALADVAHALDGRALVITGRVLNAGPEPLAQLVVDAAGFGPSGELVAAGTDGIPWAVPPGGAERFAIALPLGRTLIREYLIEVSRRGAPAALASARRGVAAALYRDHLPSLIELRGRVEAGLLTVRAEGPGLPFAQLTAEVSLLVFDPVLDGFRSVRLRVELPPDGAATVFLGTPRAILIALRLADIRLRAAWSE